MKCDTQHDNTQRNDSINMLNVIYGECPQKSLYAKCRYAECHYADGPGAGYRPYPEISD